MKPYTPYIPYLPYNLIPLCPMPYALCPYVPIPYAPFYFYHGEVSDKLEE